jgi:hypothetical protein
MIRLFLLLALAAAPAAAAEDTRPSPPQHEVLVNRPSGFWTSNRPAVGGAYRYRLLGLGCAVALGMGWLTWRIVAASRNPKPRQ